MLSSGWSFGNWVTDHIWRQFFWPKMSTKVKQYVRNCGAAPLHQILSSGPLQLVCIDFLSMEPDSRGVSNVSCNWPFYKIYSSCPDSKSKNNSEKTYVVHYGFPSQIHFDQGRDFDSQFIKQLLTTLGIQKSRPTPTGRSTTRTLQLNYVVYVSHAQPGEKAAMESTQSTSCTCLKQN